jgi:hypothetical protein
VPAMLSVTRRLSWCSWAVQPGCARYCRVSACTASADRLGKRPMSCRTWLRSACTGSPALLGGVIPALQRRAAEADLEPRERMTPALAANAFNASCNSPAPGGAANSGPTIAKRSRAHRSRCGRSFSSLTLAPLPDAILGVADGNEGYKALGRRLSASSAGTSRPSDYLVVVRVLKGAMKRSTCISRSAYRRHRSVPADSAAVV